MTGEKFCSARRQRTPSIAVAHRCDAKVRMKTSKPQQRPEGSSLVQSQPQVPSACRTVLTIQLLPCSAAAGECAILPGSANEGVNVLQQGRAGTAAEA